MLCGLNCPRRPIGPIPETLVLRRLRALRVNLFLPPLCQRGGGRRPGELAVSRLIKILITSNIARIDHLNRCLLGQ